MEDNTTLRLIMHLVMISTIGIFTYLTYDLIKSILFSPGYKILGILSVLSILYYLYKLFYYIYNFQRKEDYKLREELIKKIYPEPVKYESKPIEVEEETDIEPINDPVNIDIKIDKDRGLFYGRKLNIAEKQYLMSHNYQKGNFVPIGKVRQEECWVKPNKTESLAHTFLVQNIKQEILKYTKDVKIDISKEPDIIFKNINEEIVALEIETGLGLSKHRYELENKFFITEKRYKKNLYIILTNSKVKYQYKKLFKNIKILTRQDIPALLHSQLLPAGRHSIPAKQKRDTGRKNADK